MVYSNLWLSNIAIILDIVLLYIYLRERWTGVEQEKMYGRMLWNLFGLNLTVVVYSIVLQVVGDLPLTNLVFSWIATVFIALVPKTFLQYLNNFFYYDTQKRRAHIIVLILTAGSFLCIALFGPIVTCSQRTITLRMSEGLYLLYAEATVFLAVGFVQGFMLRKSVSRLHLQAIRMLLLLSLVSLYLFEQYQTLPAYGFMLSLVPLFCEFTLENSGLMIDLETGLRSRDAFNTSVLARLEQHIPFRVIIIHAGNLSSSIACLGDTAGDQIMEKVSLILKNVTEEPVFRLNEDAFAIVQDVHDEALTQEILISLRTKFSSVIRTDSCSIHLRMVYCIIDLPKEIRSMDDLEMVTELLDQNKERFSDRIVRVSDLRMEEEKTLREQTHALGIGLNEKRIEVWYQPILNTRTGEFESAEALVRMRNRDGGYVRPDFFIPAAEKSGLITEVGSEVFHQVCRFVTSKAREELGIRYVEVNMSVEEAIQDDMAERIRFIMEKYHATPDMINIEVTESANDMASKLVMQNMERIHDEFGIELSLDDFGTGYSNFQRLLTMPLEIIKFDRSLLLKAFESQQGRIVFERFADMIHSMGKTIVSEGVETEEQAAFVKSLGIEYIQGFHYARPMPEAEFCSFLREAKEKKARS